MKKMMAALASAALIGAPATAIQHQEQSTRQAPNTRAGAMTLYEMTGYDGDTVVVDTPSTMVHTDWNIRSIGIHPGDSWQICARSRFRDCIVLDRSIPDATMIGLQGQIGSARQAPAGTPAQAPAPAQPH